MNPHYTDTTLIQLLKSNLETEENKALQYIYHKYYQSIETWLIKKGLPPRIEVKDLFQAGLIDLFYIIKKDNFTLSNETQIKTLLFSICRNRWRNEWRSQNNRIKHEQQILIENSEEMPLEMEWINEEKSNLVAHLIAKTGSYCQRVILNFYYRKMKHEEIAEEMSFKSAQQSRNALSGCKKKLRQTILATPNWKELLL